MKLALRPLVAGDADRILAWRSAPHIREFMYEGGAPSRGEHERWLAETLSSPERLYFMVVLEGAPAGLAGLSRINPSARRCDWGFYIGDAAAQGRGAALGALYLLLGAAFGGLGLNKVWGEVLSGNLASCRLHERLGFTLEARLRDHVFRQGRHQDALGYGLLAREWPGVQTRVAARLRERGVDPDGLVAPATGS